MQKKIFDNNYEFLSEALNLKLIQTKQELIHDNNFK